MLDPDLVARVRVWADDDPDPETRDELSALVAAVDGDGLAERFGPQLSFGTAGIRGAIGAGPARMNRALVRRVAAGLAAHLTAEDAVAARERGVVIGRDARSHSDVFTADLAAVLAGAGVRVRVLPGVAPTPVLAYAVRHLRAAAGAMVTASHNPPADNGVKLYDGDGCQIVPPVDAAIAAAIEAVAAVAQLPLGDPEVLGDEVMAAYLDQAAGVVPPGPRELSVVHTAMHGVGTAALLALFARTGFALPHLVAEQAEPDGAFPTVSFPNPEEPGALDLALALAGRVGADLVLANDPDADRLAVAVPDGGSWRALTGDEVGALLGDHILSTTDGADRLVATTVVSSGLLERLAEWHGVHMATTLTGFKWIMRAAADRPGTRLVFGYEEALGYAVSDFVGDKDGLTAALAVADLAARLKADGHTLVDRLAGIAGRHGLYATHQWSVRLPGAEGVGRIASVVEAVAERPPDDLAGHAVVGRRRPAGDVIVLDLESGHRVVVRPSGTEPKLKVYLQFVVPPTEVRRVGYAPARAAAGDELERLRAAAAEVLGLVEPTSR